MLNVRGGDPLEGDGHRDESRKVLLGGEGSSRDSVWARAHTKGPRNYVSSLGGTVPGPWW